jgi:dihydroorotase/N-acyl-D-amino-acid deacylase
MRTLAALLFLCTSLFAQQYDVLIRNGRLVDGSGNPWVYADVGIVGDRITFVGTADPDVKAKKMIDAKGFIVAPGFIDMLGQSESFLLIDKQAVSKITQGVTTEVTGEGGSIAPLNQRLINEAKSFTEHFKLTLDWKSLDEYFRRLEKQGSGVNLATFVGATQVRQMVIGDDDRAPTPDELKQMQEMVDDAMYDGAVGLSTSLIYAPAFYAKTEEIIELAKVAAKRGGVYASHIRNESDHEMAAIDEALRIGKEANIPVEIFHIKVAGKQNWGRMKDVVAKIGAARAEGIDVTADQYPYPAGATSLGAAIPPKYHDGGTDKFISRLKDPEIRKQIKADLVRTDDTDFEKLYLGSGGASGVLILSVLNPELKQYEGKTVAQVAEMQHKDPIDTMMDMVIADRDNVGAAYFMIGEEDIKTAMRQPWVSVGTDHSAVNVTGPLSESKAHPRAYGSFTRILGRYVREQKLFSMEEAIRKFTSLPAQRVHLDGRGIIKPNYFADITIFDPEMVIDTATFEDPNRVSKGIQYVLVNGVVEIDNGKITGDLGGRPLRGPGYGNRAVSADGSLPKPKIQGVLTGTDGYALPRATVSLVDKSGKTVATAPSKRDGTYEMLLHQRCSECTLKAERAGFISQQKKIDFNGSNPLWFSFALEKVNH